MKRFSEPVQFQLDWNAPVDIGDTAGGSGVISLREYSFDCSALHFAAIEVIRLRARAAVKDALETGALRKPSNCERCLGPGPLESHHHDYARPLDVEWVCRSCHKDETRRILAEARASLPNHRGLSSWITRELRKSERKERDGVPCS